MEEINNYRSIVDASKKTFLLELGHFVDGLDCLNETFNCAAESSSRTAEVPLSLCRNLRPPQRRLSSVPCIAPEMRIKYLLSLLSANHMSKFGSSDRSWPMENRG